ncbi:hypothetical protein, partial [Streptomyces mirabilis]|uniref:hypothetical protein n=1 Tax=Streptomyces mirabilis TaxID=68239 RepID=UPI0033D71875
MAFVPAVLALLGKAAWWMPHWLDRILPKVDVEGEGLVHQSAVAPAPPAHDDTATPEPAHI